MLKEMRKKHHITFLTLLSSETSIKWQEQANEYCHELVSVLWDETPKYTLAFYGELLRNLIFSRLPYAIEKYVSIFFKEKIKELDSLNFDLLVCDFLATAVNLNRKTNTPTLLFQHNIESEIWKRHYQSKRTMLWRKYFWVQWKRMMEFEKNACARFDGVVTVSPHDSEILRSEFGLRNVLGDVPTGVDVDYFHPSNKSLKKGNHLVFIGSMDWLPNEDAVLYFTKEIYPLIKADVPDVRFTIAGRNPSGKIRKLHSLDPTIQVTGTVNDIRPYMASASAIVVPLRIGGGTRIKIFEGMAMGIPIVSTSIGAEGLPVVHQRNILLADKPDEFARETILLLKNPSIAANISYSALQMVRERYSWKTVVETFESYCFDLLKKCSGGRHGN
jgi:glycosyltransferase involved in cell wall biosynthesis